VPPDALAELKRTKKPQTYLTLRSPITGTVLQRNVFESQYVTPKNELYLVADLSTVWVQAKVYEYELPHVELGQPAAVTLPALPGRELNGKVVFIQPTVEEPARTVEVRIELPNDKGLLKPRMFAQVVIEHTMGEGLLAPLSAILRTGERDIAFRAEHGDVFVPVEVEIGPFQYGDHFQILKGLKAGDRVTTSANFLIDSESRLRFGGAGGMPGMQGMDMGGGKGAEKLPMHHHH
jgi:Cu(I)/Ag(I) efflux system membrane fusion protein